MTTNTMIMMDNGHQQQQSQQQSPPLQRSELQITVPLANINNNNNEGPISPTTKGKTSLKRSFDVAFLMMPDDRIKQKQQAEKIARVSETAQYPTDLSPRQVSPISPQHQTSVHSLYEHPELFSSAHDVRRYPQITVRSPRIYDDPTVVIPDIDPNPIRSAFTKVNARLESPVPPSLSPDQLSCPSMSPPISTTPPRASSRSSSTSSNNGITYHNFRPEYQFNGNFQAVNQVQALAVAQNHRLKQQLMYRPMNSVNGTSLSSHGGTPGTGSPPEFLPTYSSFPFANPAAHPFVVSPPPDIPGIVRSPAAAAILSTLIPPTLASTFSLTAQNVCAKCNISFRMTSDLVYHMRSHHKSEVACDPNRRKREEKLKCPVCNESFRERHHLTRHMTAHQDKESDNSASAAQSAAASGGNGTHSNRHHHGRTATK